MQVLRTLAYMLIGLILSYNDIMFYDISFWSIMLAVMFIDISRSLEY